MNDILKIQIEELLSLQRVPVCEGWATPEKACVLANLILENKMEAVAEVGVFGGRSLLPMAMAMRHQGFGTAWGVDPWTHEAALEGSNDPANVEWWAKLDIESIYAGFVAEVLKNKLTKECRWIREKSEVAYRTFYLDQFDMLHCDGNHSEQTSCADIDLWHNRLKKKSFIVMDDAKWPTTQKAIGKIKAKGFAVHQDYGDYIVFKRG